MLLQKFSSFSYLVIFCLQSYDRSKNKSLSRKESYLIQNSKSKFIKQIEEKNFFSYIYQQFTLYF